MTGCCDDGTSVARLSRKIGVPDPSVLVQRDLVPSAWCACSRARDAAGSINVTWARDSDELIARVTVPPALLLLIATPPRDLIVFPRHVRLCGDAAGDTPLSCSTRRRITTARVCVCVCVVAPVDATTPGFCALLCSSRTRWAAAKIGTARVSFLESVLVCSYVQNAWSDQHLRVSLYISFRKATGSRFTW